MISSLQIFLILLCSFIFAGFGCSSRPAPKPVSQTTQKLEMDPVLFTQGSDQILSADELFEQGVGAFQGQDYDTCIKKLSLFFKVFDNAATEYIHAGHYNLGLCLEAKNQFAQAAIHFRAFRDLSTDHVDRLDGEVRLGVNLIYSHSYQEGVDLFHRLLTKEKLKGLDRSECHLRKAMGLIGLKEYAQADYELSAALSHIHSVLGPHTKGNQALAEVHFQRGELYRSYMNQVELKMPQLRMKRALTTKIRYFRKAIYAYAACINIHQTYWGIAAGHQLGTLHENIYHALLEAEYPQDFDEETVAFYYHSLDKRLVPLLQESITMYEKTATLVAGYGLENEWTHSVQKRLKHLRKLEYQIQYRLTLDPLDALVVRKKDFAQLKTEQRASTQPFFITQKHTQSPSPPSIKEENKAETKKTED